MSKEFLMFSNIDETHPYYELAKVFNDAFIQASHGKGSERHSYSAAENYKDQLICEMDKRLNGNACGPRYQAVKKIYESARMDPEKAIHELLGAINYIAAAVILLKEKKEIDRINKANEEIKKEELSIKTGEVIYSRSPRRVEEPVNIPSVLSPDNKYQASYNQGEVYCNKYVLKLEEDESEERK